MWISGKEMVDVQMPFPPSEKGFDFPAQSENEGDLFGRQIGSIAGDPVDLAAGFEADEKKRVCHAVGGISESNFGKEKDPRALGDR